MSIIDEMSMGSVAVLPSMDQFNNGVHDPSVASSVVDLFSSASWSSFRESDLYFDQLPGASTSPDHSITSYCESVHEQQQHHSAVATPSGGAVEFSPASMPSSTMEDVEELFGCCTEENGDDCSCSDLLMTTAANAAAASLDLTIYGQVTTAHQPGQDPPAGVIADWGKFVDYTSPSVSASVASYNYGDLICIENGHQSAQHQPGTAHSMISLDVAACEGAHYGYSGTGGHSSGNGNVTVCWDELGTNNYRVLSILEPGLDFEGLIDLDNL